jgi:transcriptional regulator with XRE-family HTH domain
LNCGIKRKGKPDLKARFGLAVRKRRQEMGFSQEVLSERAGLHRTYVADIERGARNLSIKNIQKLTDSFGLSIAEFFARYVIEK